MTRALRFMLAGIVAAAAMGRDFRAVWPTPRGGSVGTACSYDSDCQGGLYCDVAPGQYVVGTCRA